MYVMVYCSPVRGDVSRVRAEGKPEAVIGLGVPVLRLIAIAMPALGVTNHLHAGAFRGAGDARRMPVVFG